MISPRNTTRICMRFAAARKGKSSRDRKLPVPATGARGKGLTRRETINLVFENCNGCLTMAAIPHGAFAARKVRENNERRFLISKMERKGDNDKEQGKQETGYSKKNANTEEGRELTPLKYNSKLMNSIWGLYNRYSVHNFKKNTDAHELAADSAAALYRGPCGARNRPPTQAMYRIEDTAVAAARVQRLLGNGNVRL